MRLENKGIYMYTTVADLEGLISGTEFVGWSTVAPWYDWEMTMGTMTGQYNWLIVTPEHLNSTSSSPAMDPAKILTTLFGTSLTKRNTHGLTGQYIGTTGVQSGGDLEGVSAAFMESLSAHLATTYYGQAAISYVPLQIESVTSDTVIGFFDHTSGFGLTYAWDIYFSVLNPTMYLDAADEADGFEFNPWELAGREGIADGDYAGAFSGVMTDSIYAGYESTGWTNTSMLGADNITTYSHYPPRGAGTGGIGTTSPFDVATSTALWTGVDASGYGSVLPRGHTYVMEAMAMDYFDTVDYSGNGDAGEMLVSDELYRAGPNKTDVSYEVSNDVDKYVLNWSPSANFREVMKLRYHTMSTSDTKELGFVTAMGGGLESQVYMGDTWTGSHEYEKLMRETMIASECEKVYELYEVSELPKRFINKVQKRRDIPDGAVSAFGYIPPDGSAFSTTMSSYGAAPGEEGYFADTMGSDSTDGYDYGEEVIAGYGAGIGPWTYTATGFTGHYEPGTTFAELTADEYRQARALDTGECVIATHAVSSGMFSTEDKANAVDWCTNKLHGKWWGETMRRGYRYLGRKHIANGTAELVYDEFKECIEWANGKRPFELRIALRYAFRVAQTFIVGLFVKEDE